MGLIEQLQEQGWYITQTGLDKLLESDKNAPATTSPDVKQVVKLALNADLRDYGGGALNSLATRGTKVESFEGSGVVQLVKMRNLGAPRVNEDSKTAPRLLKLILTDGQTQFLALEHEPIPSISINTPPGTKILLKNGPIRIASGVMLLGEKNVTVLGGQVTALVEKWELSRTMAKYAKGGRLQFSTSGPPPWIPFGQKIQQPTSVNSDKDFKSLQSKEKEESKENSEFNALRNDAIAEAAKLGTKKTFGGGAKQMVDANVQKIMDRGFTEEQANHALKLTRNNVDRALSNLQRIEGRKQAQADGTAGGSEGGGSSRVGGKRGYNKRDDEAELQTKPLGKVSLFDYFGDILQDSEPASGNATGGKSKTQSKESTPSDKAVAQRTRSDSAGRAEGNQRSAGANSRNHPSGTSRNQSDGNSHYAGGVTNGGTAKSYNQQRFENNISSSFANRNSGRERGRDQGHYASGQRDQQQQQSGYKQSDYYGSSAAGGNSGNNNRYGRGANDNHSSGTTGASGGSGARSGGGGGNSRANDSKYNQQHQSSSSAGYGNARSERSDAYHGNSNNSTSTATASSNHGNNNPGTAASGGSGTKYGGGKGQSGNSSAHANNTYGLDGRNNHQQQSQYGNEGQGRGQAGSGKGGGASGGSNQQQGASVQSSHGAGSKQSNYNQSSGTTPNSHGHHHHGQQQGGGGGGSGGGNSYGAGSNTSTKNSGKNNRYGGKDESHKYSDGGAPQNAHPGGSTQNKKQPPKGSQNQSTAGAAAGPEQRSTYAPPSASGGKQQQSNASTSGKANQQLSEQFGSMQISNSKSSGYVGGSANGANNAGNSSTGTPNANVPSSGKAGAMKQMVPNHPPTTGQHQQQQQQQHAPQVASPPVPMSSPGPGGPSPGAPATPGAPTTGPGGPKNFIQLPNGYNYNPYQIMGFQNKQTNEFALNVLKSQQQFEPVAQPTHLSAPTTTGPIPVSQPVGPGVGVPMATAGAPPTGVLVSSPAVIAPGPPTSAAVPLAAPLAMAPAVVPAPPMAVPFPNWKIGDRCLAKYWEDGGFYPAQITDTSKNTFVVHFLDYGNFEEVLKTDCIPINQPTTASAPPPTMALSYHPAAGPGHIPASPQQSAPVAYAPLPSHAQHPAHPHAHGHHGHVPPHHPPPQMAAPPAAYPPAPLPDYAAYKPGGTPQMAQPMGPAQGGQPMNQYQPTQLHLQQQQQPQQQQQHQQPQLQHHQPPPPPPQQQQPQGGHMAQAHHLHQQHHHQHQQMQSQQAPQHHAQHQQLQRGAGGKFREQRPMYVPPAQRK